VSNPCLPAAGAFPPNSLATGAQLQVDANRREDLQFFHDMLLGADSADFARAAEPSSSILRRLARFPCSSHGAPPPREHPDASSRVACSAATRVPPSSRQAHACTRSIRTRTRPEQHVPWPPASLA